MKIIAALVCLVATSAPAAQAPFKATARLGVPFTLGFQEVVMGTKEKLDTGTLRIVTLSSARVAATYPNLSDIVSAGAGEKLLILRGSLTNPSKVTLPISPSGCFSVRFWDGKGKGAFKYVGAYEPDTRKWLQGNLRKGQSAAFDCVIRIPASFDPFRVGLYYQNRAKIAWYDLTPNLAKMASAFSPDGLALVDRARVAMGQPFDFDTFKMKVLRLSEPDSIGGAAKGSQPLLAVSVEVTNTMFLPARWGWQYVTPELVMKDGSVLAAVRDLIDKATDKTWSGDLAPGATMTAQFVFRPTSGQIPAAFRLTLPATQRTIEAPLN